jgi:hypothetical protein
MPMTEGSHVRAEKFHSRQQEQFSLELSDEIKDEIFLTQKIR